MQCELVQDTEADTNSKLLQTKQIMSLCFFGIFSSLEGKLRLQKHVKISDVYSLRWSWEGGLWPNVSERSRYESKVVNMSNVLLKCPCDAKLRHTDMWSAETLPDDFLSRRRLIFECLILWLVWTIHRRLKMLFIQRFHTKAQWTWIWHHENKPRLCMDKMQRCPDNL